MIPPEIVEILKKMISAGTYLEILRGFIEWFRKNRFSKEEYPPEKILSLIEPYVEDKEIINKIRKIFEAKKIGLIKRSVMEGLLDYIDAKQYKPSIKNTIDTLKNFMTESDYNILRESYASYMAEIKNNLPRAGKIKGKIIKKWGERGRKIWNLVRSGEIEYVVSIAVNCLFTYINNVIKMKECFQKKFDDMLNYYENAIFVSELEPDMEELENSIIDRFVFKKAKEIRIYGRGEVAEYKIEKALKLSKERLFETFNIDIDWKKESIKVLGKHSIIVYVRKK